MITMTAPRWGAIPRQRPLVRRVHVPPWVDIAIATQPDDPMPDDFVDTIAVELVLKSDRPELARMLRPAERVYALVLGRKLGMSASAVGERLHISGDTLKDLRAQVVAVPDAVDA